MVYTYVLKDVDNDIFKIGRTANPQGRFDNLCVKDRIFPVALFVGDFEMELHKEFSDNRVDHPDKTIKGFTEFFRRGGKFDGFIEKFEEAEVPYCKPTSLVKEMMEMGRVVMSDPFMLWDISNDKFGWYNIGRKLLQGLGKITDKGYGDVKVHGKDVSYINRKLAITGRLYDDILNDDDIVIKLYEDMDNIVVNVDDYVSTYKSDERLLHMVISS